jgi:hypothetical protein
MGGPCWCTPPPTKEEQELDEEDLRQQESEAGVCLTQEEIEQEREQLLLDYLAEREEEL